MPKHINYDFIKEHLELMEEHDISGMAVKMETENEETLYDFLVDEDAIEITISKVKEDAPE